MKKCFRCKNRIANDASFCPVCGVDFTRLSEPNSLVIPTLKKMATSPLYLACAIAYTCQIVFSICSLIWDRASVISMLQEYLGSGAASLEMSMAVNSLSQDFSGIDVAFFLAYIPTILMSVGIWMLFLSAKNETNDTLNPSGLTFVKVSTIISIVCLILTTLFVEFIFFILAWAFKGIADDLSSVVVTLMVMFAVFMVFPIFMYIKVVTTVNTMKRTIQTQVPSYKVSVFVAVMSIVSGAGQIISLLNSISLFSVLSTVSMAVACIGFGVFLFRYRKEMQMLMAGNIQQDGYTMK